MTRGTETCSGPWGQLCASGSTQEWRSCGATVSKTDPAALSAGLEAETRSVQVGRHEVGVDLRSAYWGSARFDIPLRLVGIGDDKVTARQKPDKAQPSHIWPAAPTPDVAMLSLHAYGTWMVVPPEGRVRCDYTSHVSQTSGSLHRPQRALAFLEHSLSALGSKSASQLLFPSPCLPFSLLICKRTAVI